mmetsp:Transcript_39808/g.72567  ORF Transcript_39808/g.72567 Transcript_39808/m.72567 type:complete len:102 (+) Transcript_39808:35-340(+)
MRLCTASTLALPNRQCIGPTLRHWQGKVEHSLNQTLCCAARVERALDLSDEAMLEEGLEKVTSLLPFVLALLWQLSVLLLACSPTLDPCNARNLETRGAEN